MSFITDLLSKVKKSSGLGRVDRTRNIGIDIGASSIKVVQLRRDHGKIFLDTYGEIALGPYVDKEVGETVLLDVDIAAKAITDLVREANVTGNNGGFSIQSASSLIFVLHVPVMDKKDIEGVVLSEARKYIPIPMNEVSVDWWPLPQPEIMTRLAGDEETGTEVLIAAIRNERLHMYENIMGQSPLRDTFFELEIFSTMRAVTKHELASIAIIDLGASGTRVAIMQYGVLKRFSTIKRGSYQITETIKKELAVSFPDAEQLKKEVGLQGTVENGQAEVSRITHTAVETIITEIKGSLLRYEKDYQKAVSKIILTGGGARMPGLLEYFQKEFTGEITLADPFSRAEAPDFLDQVLELSGPEFSVATGLALKGWD
ncbi:MAG: type IV pilus assembly protein PilM [Planctomycetota bacterium]|jgi:type IV pilus assembly protein PilM